MKQFILKVSEWHTSLFLTSLPLPPPLYFFLGQNYSENVFEFVNHFDSPSPLTFAGKFTLCQKTVPPAPASSYNLLSCQGLSGHGWGTDCLGDTTPMVQRKSGPGGQTPASLWAAMGFVAQSSPTLHHGCLEKAPRHPLLRRNGESGSDRSHHAEGVPHQAVASGYLGSASSFDSLGKIFHSTPGPWRLRGYPTGAQSCLLSSIWKFWLWLRWKYDSSKACNAIQRLDSLQPGNS